MSGLTPEGMQHGAQSWDSPSFRFNFPPCSQCAIGLCSAHPSGGFLTSTMEGVPFSFQDYPPASPMSPGVNYALQAPPSPFDYGYPPTDISDIFPCINVNPQDILALTGTENAGARGTHGPRPPPLKIGMPGDVYDPFAPYPSSANTDISMPSTASSISFLPTPEESHMIQISMPSSASSIPFLPMPEEPQVIQISGDSEYKARVGSEAMIAASSKRRKKQGSFVCKYCGANLTSSHNMKYHTDAHFNIRPYKCHYPGCSFATTAPATAKRHCKTCKHGQL